MTKFSMIHQFDIHSEPQTLNNFASAHNILIYKNESGDDQFDYNVMFSFLSDTSKFKKTELGSVIESIYTSISELKVGDIVKLQFTPNSQKYIEYYEEQNVMGRVFFIDVENDDALIYYDKTNENGEQVRVILSFNRPYCSYFGTARGYNHSILKITM
jgi:hypothetical protein